jgi:hypothetical protein
MIGILKRHIRRKELTQARDKARAALKAAEARGDTREVGKLRHLTAELTTRLLAVDFRPRARSTGWRGAR